MQPYLNVDATHARARQDLARARSAASWTSPRGSELTLRLRVGARLRSAHLYRGAADIGCGPLFVLLHDARGRAAALRTRTGLAFERWADSHGAALVYPDGVAGHWNDARRHAPSPARRLDVDDVGFVRTLVAHLGPQRRCYAVGFGAGGHLAWRLAAQPDAPFAGYVSVGANLARPGDAGYSLMRLHAPVLLVADAREAVDERPSAETLAALRAVAAPGVAVRRVEADWLDLATQVARAFGEQAASSIC